MRELVFDEASFPGAAELDRATAAGRLAGLARGIATLVNRRIVTTCLRTRRPLSQIPLGRGVFLDARIREMLAFELRDDAVFLARLTTRTPLLSDLGPAVVDRFRGCEAKAADPALGEALVLCAHVDGVAAGVPSRQEWDRDRLTVRFEELLPDGTIEEVSDPVDHLARAEHARPILARHIAQVRRDLDFRSLWSRRHDAFPNLVFGPDVEEQLRGMAIGLLPTVVRRLA